MTHGPSPIGGGISPGRLGELLDDLIDYHLDHPVEQSLLVGDVVVQGHSLDTEPFGETTHSDRTQTLAVGERHSFLEDPLPAQWEACGLATCNHE